MGFFELNKPGVAEKSIGILENIGSGGGTRTPDTRIMIPLLYPKEHNSSHKLQIAILSLSRLRHTVVY